MNPNAPSFGFNPAAAGFVPRFLQQQQQQQQQEQKQLAMPFTKSYERRGVWVGVIM